MLTDVLRYDFIRDLWDNLTIKVYVLTYTLLLTYKGFEKSPVHISQKLLSKVHIGT